MIATTYSRPERVYGPVDYLLTGIYACLAAYATGMSIGSPGTAWMFVAIIAAGTLFSFAVQWLIGDQPVAKFDGLLYLAVGFAVFFFREDLGKLAPDQPFQDQLALTGVFMWMLALGSFFTWRDGTLLFQAVPSIALFGMVGVFDTFKPVPFLFFGLLICLATLFARAHRRQMVEQAEASGYKAMLAREEEAEARATGEEIQAGGARLQAILQGPWKWMAGPEWALASALAIVMISLLGAPVMQVALQPIAGAIHVPAPPLTSTQAAALLGHEDSSRVSVGLGPAHLGDRVVLLADLDEKRYLRIRSYAVYDSIGWQNAFQTSGPTGAFSNGEDTESVSSRSLREIKHPIRVPFKVTIEDPTIGGIPVPGEIADATDLHAEGASDIKPIRQQDGTFGIEQINGNDAIPPFSGVATVSSDTAVPRDAVPASDLPNKMAAYADKSGIPEDVAALAETVTKGAKTDFEKAQLIQQEIERRCKYNLNAPRTPGGVDPVENFLFKSQQGYCDLFGSSMTLMARSVGIPARYVTGFYPIKGTPSPDGKGWAITEAEAHAWSELFFKDVGWVPFDATEGAVGVGDPTIGKAWYRQQWFENDLNGAIILLVLAGGIYAFYVYRRAARSHVPSREDVGKEYERFVALLQKRSGRRRLPSQTPDEYLKMNRAVLGDHVNAAETLTKKFENALYSPSVISESILKDLREGTESLRQELRSDGKHRPLAGSKK